MTDEEKKAWNEMLEVAKYNLSLPIADEKFRMAQQVFIAADAELTALRTLLRIEEENREVLLRSIDPLRTRLSLAEKAVEAAREQVSSHYWIGPSGQVTCQCDLCTALRALDAGKG